MNFLKNSRFLKAGIVFISVSFILSGIIVRGYAGESNNKLRPPAPAAQSDPIKAAADAAFLRIVPQNVHEGKGSSDVGSGLTIKQLVALPGLTSAFVGHTATRERYITEAREKLGVIRPSTRFDSIINDRIKVIRGFVTRDEFERENLNFEVLLRKFIGKGYLIKFLEKDYVFEEGFRVNPEFVGLDDDFKDSLKNGPFSYSEKQIKQIEAILQQALFTREKIKEIHLGVGSVRKNIEIKDEIGEIERQLDRDLRLINLADLQEVNFNISYEPSIDIKPLKEKELKEMVHKVHQFIYDWFVRNYGEDAIEPIWGKTLKILFRGSVIKDKNKDNATPIMAVKVKSKKGKEIPGVHGVVFATSGKNVEGYLGVAQVVQKAAKRDGLQYVVMMNLKSVEDDDKDRTPPKEYVNQIYAALADGRLDRAFIVPEIAAPDVELKDWVRLVAKAEAPAVVTKGSTLGEMKWEMVKQSALYSNNNLALTGIEARSSSLSTGHPTVEAKFILKSRGGREIIITGEAASGASAGNREALFLFDGAFAKKAEKQPAMLTDAMIEDIYGKGVDRKEALRKLKANNEGKGVEITLWIARNVLIPELTKAIKEGKLDPRERYSVDRFMREYEKTHGGDERQKLKLTGANTTAFSTAAAKLGAAFNNMAPWEFLAYRPDPKSLEINYESFEVLIPIAVLIEGGEHGNWNTDWQEYMVEVRGDSFEEIALKLKNITFALDKIIQKRGDKIGVGLESGYLPTLTSNTEPIEMIVQAGKNAGYVPGKDFAVALDCAASEFYKKYNGKYYYWYSLEGKNNEQVSLTSGKKIGKIVDIQKEGEETPGRFLLLTSEEQLEWALDICKNPNYYISSVEDFFDQNDLWGNMMLTRTLQDKNFIAGLPHEFQRKDGIRQDAISHVADDFTTSNIDVVRAGIDGGKVLFEGEEGKEELVLEKDSVDAVLLKLNQAGTVQEIMELVEYLRSRGRTIAHSHRGKEPSKETIRADVALASTTYPSSRHDRTGAPARVKIKYGTIRKERAVVYDYLLEAFEKIRRKVEEAKIKTNLEPEKPIVVAEVKEKIVEQAPSRHIDTGEIGSREDEKRTGIDARERAKAVSTLTPLLDINAIISRISQPFGIPEAAISGFVNDEAISFDAIGGKEYSNLVDSAKGNLGKPRALVIDARSFELIGVTSAIQKITELFDSGYKIGLYGKGAEKLKALFGSSDNIIAADTDKATLSELNRVFGITSADAVVLTYSELNLEIGVKQVVVSSGGAALLVVARALKELANNPEVDKAFKEFYQNIQTEGVIPEQGETEAFEMLTKVEGAGIIDLSDIKLAKGTAKDIEKEAEAVKTFIFEFVTKD